MSDKKIIMPSIFEAAQQEVIERYNKRIAKIQQEIDDIESASKKYDSGLTDIEDRNYVRDLRNEIRQLEAERDREVSDLSTNHR